MDKLTKLNAELAAVPLPDECKVPNSLKLICDRIDSAYSTAVQIFSFLNWIGGDAARLDSLESSPQNFLALTETLVESKRVLYVIENFHTSLAAYLKGFGGDFVKDDVTYARHVEFCKRMRLVTFVKNMAPSCRTFIKRDRPPRAVQTMEIDNKNTPTNIDVSDLEFYKQYYPKGCNFLQENISDLVQRFLDDPFSTRQFGSGGYKIVPKKRRAAESLENETESTSSNNQHECPNCGDVLVKCKYCHTCLICACKC